MATMKVEGFEEYLAQMQKLYGSSEELAKRALYKGAGVVADKISAGLSSLPTRDPNKYYRDTKAPGLSPEEKAQVCNNFGLTDMKEEGTAFYTQAGFKGYYTQPKGKDGKRKRVATKTLARYAESGTSWMQKSPVIRRATNAAKAQAEAAMQKQYDEDLKKIMR